MSTLVDRLASVVARHGDRPAVVEGARVLTYADLWRRVTALATRLAEGGVGPGERVALLLPNGEPFVTSYLAVVTAGAVAVPLNPQYQEPELEGFLGSGAAALLLTSSAYAPLGRRVVAAPQARRRLLLVDEALAEIDRAPGPARLPGVALASDAPLMAQFSSGSTGPPKPIVRTHANVLFELEGLGRALGLSAEDRFLGVAPFSHVNGLVRSMLASLAAGASLHPLPAFGRGAVLASVAAHRLTVFIAVPFMFGMLARGRAAPPGALGSVRLAVSASAPMPRAANVAFKTRFGFWVRQLYGSTETGSVSVNLDADVEPTLESVGTPIAGVAVRIVAEGGGDARPGAGGEVAVRSPAAIAGYEGMDDLNRRVFRDGWFLTGDLGHRDDEGRLYLTGRTTFVINKGGYKIAPREIEALIETHPAVAEAVVVGVPTPLGDERIKAVIVPRGDVSPEAIVAHLRGKIAAFKIPSQIELRERLPRNPAGKVQRSRLAADDA